MKPMVSEVRVYQGHSFTSKCLKGLMLRSITSSYLLPRGNLTPHVTKEGIWSHFCAVFLSVQGRWMRDGFSHVPR